MTMVFGNWLVDPDRVIEVFAPAMSALNRLWHVLLAAAPGLMALAILIVGLMWITAGANEVKAAKAKKQAVRVAVGILMYGAYIAAKSTLLWLNAWMPQGFGGG